MTPNRPRHAGPRAVAGLAVSVAAVVASLAVPAAADAQFGFRTQWGSSGNGDGQFQAPTGITTDPSGNVYVVDAIQGRVQKFDNDGNFILAWGSSDCGWLTLPNGAQSPPPLDELCGPLGIGSDAQGDIYVADSHNARVVKFTSDGTPITQRFRPGHFCVGSATQYPCFPTGVTTDSSGDVYVADPGAGILALGQVKVFDAQLNLFLRAWGSGRLACVFPSGNDLCSPTNVDVGPQSRVFVTDDKLVNVQRFDTDGNRQTGWGSFGSEPGQFGSPPRIFNVSPWGVGVNATGTAYVSDPGNSRIESFDSDGAFLSQFGTTGSGPGDFRRPHGVAVDASGSLFVADTGNDRVQKFGEPPPPPPGPPAPPAPPAPPPPGPTPTVQVLNAGSPLLGPLAFTHQRFLATDPDEIDGVQSSQASEDAAAAGGSRRPKGTTFLFTLSEPGEVTFFVDRRLSGRRDQGRCRKPTRRNRNRRRCVRHKRVGAVKFDAEDGLNRFAWDGRVGGRKLRHASYRIRARAIADGERSNTQTTTVRILEP